MARDTVGCLGGMAITITFYILFAVVLLTLVIYPLIYLGDVSAASSYSRAQVSVVAGTISNVHPDNGRLTFDFVPQGGTLYSVQKESGAYTPQNGDIATARLWRTNPVLVTGPEGTSLVTSQDPQARLRGDQSVLWLFLVGGVIALGGAGLIGWFGHRIVFARLIGARRGDVVKGFAVVMLIIAIVVPIVLLGQAQGGWVGTRAGGQVIAVALGVMVLGAIVLFRRFRRAR